MLCVCEFSSSNLKLVCLHTLSVTDSAGFGDVLAARESSPLEKQILMSLYDVTDFTKASSSHPHTCSEKQAPKHMFSNKILASVTTGYETGKVKSETR